MASTYSGLAANVSQLGAGPIAIASSTNATPIVVTKVAHGLTTGDVISVSKHATNVAANGIWKVQVLTADTFSLLTLAGANSVGVGVGGATGYFVCFVPKPLITLASDGDARSAAARNVGLAALADRTAWLAQRVTGAYRVDQVVPTISSGGAGVLSAAWSTRADVTAAYVENPDVTGAFPAPVDVDTGDLVDVAFHTKIINGGVGMTFSLWYQRVEHGAAASFAAATRLEGSGVALPAGHDGPLCLRGVVPVGALGHGYKLQIFLAAIAAVAGPNGYTLHGDSELIATVYRSSP